MVPDWPERAYPCRHTQVHEANSGRDPFPVFLRRAKLPKVGARNSCAIQRTIACRPLQHETLIHMICWVSVVALHPSE